MKAPEGSCTSSFPPMDIPFAHKSFCSYGLRQTQIYNKQTKFILPQLLKCRDEGHFHFTLILNNLLYQICFRPCSRLANLKKEA